jgi:hypothetical protein
LAECSAGDFADFPKGAKLGDPGFYSSRFGSGITDAGYNPESYKPISKSSMSFSDIACLLALRWHSNN